MLLGPSLLRERMKQVLYKPRDRYDGGEAEGEVGPPHGGTPQGVSVTPTEDSRERRHEEKYTSIRRGG